MILSARSSGLWLCWSKFLQIAWNFDYLMIFSAGSSGLCFVLLILILVFTICVKFILCNDPFCRILWALVMLILLFTICVKSRLFDDPFCRIFWALLMLILVFTICVKFRLFDDPFCRIFWALPHQPRWRKAWPCTQSRWPPLTAISFKNWKYKIQACKNTTYHIIWWLLLTAFSFIIDSMKSKRAKNVR